MRRDVPIPNRRKCLDAEKERAEKTAVQVTAGRTVQRIRPAKQVSPGEQRINHQIGCYYGRQKARPRQVQQQVVRTERSPKAQSCPLDIEAAVAIEQALAALLRYD